MLNRHLSIGLKIKLYIHYFFFFLFCRLVSSCWCF
uniref:Uncharacterized protein n=1 Tax=Anguilla anguilla TaxID=7936 RepID=A0A0E9XF96_ANGAN